MKRAGSSLKRKFVLVVLWLGFVGLWYRVRTITGFPDVTDSFSYLVNIISAYGLLVIVWVFHNIAIYRKKGPRQGVRFLNYAATHDALQSYIMRKTDLKRTQTITVNVVNGQKLFLDGGIERKRDLAGSLVTP